MSPEPPGNNATFDSGGYTIGNPYYRTEVGDHETSDSPYGTFDQGGNVWEWNEAVFFGIYRGVWSGAFDNGDLYLLAAIRGVFPSDEANNIGFRVSEVPEPATMALLAVGGAALLRKRHRK